MGEGGFRVRGGWKVAVHGPRGEHLELGISEPEDLALARAWLARIELPPAVTLPENAPFAAIVPEGIGEHCQPCKSCGSTHLGLHIETCGHYGSNPRRLMQMLRMTRLSIGVDHPAEKALLAAETALLEATGW